MTYMPEQLCLRQGRRNPHAVYIGIAPEPSDDDIPVGFFISPEIAAWVVTQANGGADWLALAEMLNDD